jgi:hypothetical protein
VTVGERVPRPHPERIPELARGKREPEAREREHSRLGDRNLIEVDRVDPDAPLFPKLRESGRFGSDANARLNRPSAPSGSFVEGRR